MEKGRPRSEPPPRPHFSLPSPPAPRSARHRLALPRPRKPLAFLPSPRAAPAFVSARGRGAAQSRGASGRGPPSADKGAGRGGEPKAGSGPMGRGRRRPRRPCQSAMLGDPRRRPLLADPRRRGASLPRDTSTRCRAGKAAGAGIPL